MNPEALVLVNPAAHGGQALARLEPVRPALEAVCSPTFLTLDRHSGWETAIAGAIARGTRFFVGAGGDGTMHALVNALDAQRGGTPLGDFRLGAIGLGSSNDYHKPVIRDVRGVPVRLDRSAARPRDLILCTWEGGRALVVVSASIGLTAAANAFFNHGDTLLEWLKPRSSDLAILWAAVHTIGHFRPLVGEVAIDGRSRAYRINNLSVLKTQWLSGILRYDTPVDPADGWLAVNLLEGRSRPGALLALASLARGRFSALAGAHGHRARVVEVILDSQAHLELDGEITGAREIRLELFPERILACA